MALPIREIPKRLKKSLQAFRKLFTKPQFSHFTRLTTGQIISDRKNIREVNDCFGKRNQSSLNRFVNESEWDIKEVNKVRLREVRKKLALGNGFLVIDPTLLHKTGKKMEKANYHYSGITKKKEWGHLLVDSIFTDWKGNTFPVNAEFYVRKVDADKKTVFRELRKICLDMLDEAIRYNLPIRVVMVDAGLYADYLLNEIKLRNKKYVAGVRVTNKYSFEGEKRISVSDHLKKLTDDNFERFVINGNVYCLHTVLVSTRGVGQERLLISYKQGDEENVKVYTTNLISWNSSRLMELLLKRWKVEVWHRDAKQSLGLEDYQVRKFDAIQKVVCVVLVAYTLLILNLSHAILKPFQRSLETVGEGCRFFRLIGLKGWMWLRRQSENAGNLRKVLNEQVFKTAKV